MTLAVRNLAQGEGSATLLRQQFPQATITVMHLDLADLASVRRFAAAWADTGQALHVLVNNAAVMACPLQRTARGWEFQFATNHLGHFALAAGLLPALRRAGLGDGDARVVCLSSSGHKLAGVQRDDIHFEQRPYDKWKAYGQAKSANALFSLGLHRRCAADGITANAVHPGGIMTGLQKHLQHAEMRAFGWFKEDGTPHDRFKNPAQGAATSAWAASAPELRGNGGLYLEDCNQALPSEPGDRISGHAPHIMDTDIAERLWAASEQMLASVH